MEQMGNCPQIFSSSNYAALLPLSRRWTLDTGLGPGTFLAFIFGGGRNNSSGVIYLVGKIFGQVGLGWAGLGWAQEGILNSNLCQDWKTGLNEGRPRGAALCRTAPVV